jgi:hypothetical protein
MRQVSASITPELPGWLHEAETPPNALLIFNKLHRSFWREATSSLVPQRGQMLSASAAAAATTIRHKPLGLWIRIWAGAFAVP